MHKLSANKQYGCVMCLCLRRRSLSEIRTARVLQMDRLIRISPFSCPKHLLVCVLHFVPKVFYSFFSNILPCKCCLYYYQLGV